MQIYQKVKLKNW